MACRSPRRLETTKVLSQRLSSIRVLSTSNRSPPSERCPGLDLLSWRGGLNSVPTSSSLTFGAEDVSHPRLGKLLVNVSVERSSGSVHVVMPSDSTVNDLIKIALEIYIKEKRRPFLEETNPKCFQLHYSQFSLECIRREEKLLNLGSRNFFLYLNPCLSITSCGSQEAKLASKSLFSLTKFMEFLL